MANKYNFQSTKISAKNRKEAEKKAKSFVDTIYNKKYKVTDIVYVKGSKMKNYEGKVLKRYGIVYRRKKK